jgi:hypothetical protein
MSDKLSTAVTTAVSYATNQQKIFTATSVAGIAVLSLLAQCGWGLLTNKEVIDKDGKVTKAAQPNSAIIINSGLSALTHASIAAPVLFAITQCFHRNTVASLCVGLMTCASVYKTFDKKSGLKASIQDAALTKEGVGVATLFGLAAGALATAAASAYSAR